MPSGYPHLTHSERGRIHARLHRGLSQREIARWLERDPTTIARETSQHLGLLVRARRAVKRRVREDDGGTARLGGQVATLPRVGSRTVKIGASGGQRARSGR